MLIAFHGIDRPDSIELRMATRPAHLAFHAERSNLVGGPLRDANGGVCGSLIIFEAPDLATASAQMAADPYVIAGLFETYSVTEFVALAWPASEVPGRSPSS